ncbi:MAG: hypothetical protein K940chlam1_01154, partial [Candidatus Anoxychlamydiales bacterium]|nr:hypothetical protein [Candidatus Anoxychlamydiales bacterium]
MKKFYLIIFLLTPILLFSKPLKIKDINPVMERIFEYHIEFKNYNETVITRSFK